MAVAVVHRDGADYIYSAATTHTYAGLTLGAGDADQLVYVGVLVNQASVPSAVAIDGVSAAQVPHSPIPGTSYEMSLWWAHVPSTTTGDVQVDFASAISVNVGISVTSVTGADTTNPVPATNGSDYDYQTSGLTLTGTVDVPAGGALAAWAWPVTPRGVATSTWTNATEDWDHYTQGTTAHYYSAAGDSGYTATCTSSNTLAQAGMFTLALQPPSTGVDLAADGISTTAGLGAPALTQAQVLAAAGIDGSAMLGAAIVSQVQGLAGDGIAAAAVLGTPLALPTYSLVAAGVAADGLLGDPAVGQVHVLAAAGIAGAVLLAQPALGELHALVADGLALAWAMGTPSVSEVNALVADGLPAGNVALGAPGLVLIVNLAAAGPTIAAILGTPALGQVQALAAPELTLAATLGAPSLASAQALAADALVFAAPVLGAGYLGDRRISAHHSGAWQVPDGFAKHAGTWKPIIKGWRRAGGVWAEIYS